MTKPPEQIWAWPGNRGWYAAECSSEVNLGLCGEQSDQQRKYIREDLVNARIAELQAEIKAYKRAEEAPRKGALIDVISDEDWLYDEPDTWKIEVGQLKNDLV